MGVTILKTTVILTLLKNYRCLGITTKNYRCLGITSKIYTVIESLTIPNYIGIKYFSIFNTTIFIEAISIALKKVPS